MSTEPRGLAVHHPGEQPEVAVALAISDTFAGRIHVEWDAAAPMTPFGQLPFFIDCLKQAGLFEGWVADCPLRFASPNAPRRRDLLGTVLLSATQWVPDRKAPRPYVRCRTGGSSLRYVTSEGCARVASVGPQHIARTSRAAAIAREMSAFLWAIGQQIKPRLAD